MVIRNSKQLLEHISEVEEKIQLVEKLMEDLKIDCDKEQLLQAILARRFFQTTGQKN